MVKNAFNIPKCHIKAAEDDITTKTVTLCTVKGSML